MEYKRICPKHSFRYSGSRCPICEQERIHTMVKKYIPPEEPEPIEGTDEEPDFSVLAEKFRIGKL